MRVRKGRLLLGNTRSISIFLPSMGVKFACGISNLAKMSVERARLLSGRELADWLFRELNLGRKRLGRKCALIFLIAQFGDRRVDFSDPFLRLPGTLNQVADARLTSASAISSLKH